MSKPPKSKDGATELIPKDGGAAKPADMDNMMTTIRTRVAGRLVITDGPGRGQSLMFYEGSNSIGRDATRNVVALDFGDASVHRDPHAYLTCQNQSCTLASSGKANPVSINGRTLDGSQPVSPGDTIQIGKTTLTLFVD